MGGAVVFGASPVGVTWLSHLPELALIEAESVPHIAGRLYLYYRCGILSIIDEL